MFRPEVDIIFLMCWSSPIRFLVAPRQNHVPGDWFFFLKSNISKATRKNINIFPNKSSDDQWIAYSWPIIKKLISSANFYPSGGKPCPLPTSGSDASAATSRQQMRRRRWSWYWMSSSARWEELGESRWLGFLGKIMENVHILSVNSNFTWKIVLNDLKWFKYH